MIPSIPTYHRGSLRLRFIRLAERHLMPCTEQDWRAFEVRPWIITAGRDMVDVRDPDDGVSLVAILAELSPRFQGKGTTDHQRHPPCGDPVVSVHSPQFTRISRCRTRV
jgi:hypothetical protein